MYQFKVGVPPPSPPPQAASVDARTSAAAEPPSAGRDDGRPCREPLTGGPFLFTCPTETASDRRAATDGHRGFRTVAQVTMGVNSNETAS
jgi:hypothetical protein